MSHKRSRAQFEADLQAQQSPYVAFGTPLPAVDPDVRDDGSYVPIWKQEVTDERGRKRLHGAFTGGFSAGYFNTVGSKEGWTPTTFTSSRSNRNKNAHTQQKAEDFMDEEDLREAEESKKVSTDTSYSGLGSTENEVAAKRTVMDILRDTSETIGTKLLRKMGWRDGQGIGPKVRRRARLDDNTHTDDEGGDSHWFAPDNSPMIAFQRKFDHKGVGYVTEQKLGSGSKLLKDTTVDDNDESFQSLKPRSKEAKRRNGLGVGILNDDGSDEEDPYEIGPRISYNRTLVGDKKKKRRPMENGTRRSLGNANPLLKDKPIFLSKRASLPNNKTDLKRCHDGRKPLQGFVLSSGPVYRQEAKYHPPAVPDNWMSSKGISLLTSASSAQSTILTSECSTHNPSTRASLLGEASLPGKSIFSYLSPSARDRIATLTNNPSLPAGGSEIPSSAPMDSLIPPLDPDIAATALGRGVAGFVPYADNPAKLTRYRTFLSYRANLTTTSPVVPKGMNSDEWRAELVEFAHAATIFKPMTGLMASRFTSSSSSSSGVGIAAKGADAGDNDSDRLLRQPSQKKSDPAEEAAQLGMFGPMTRSSVRFYPSRLLCKRFDVPPPPWTAEDAGAGQGVEPGVSKASTGPDFTSRFASGGVQVGTEDLHGVGTVKAKELLGKDEMDALRREAGVESTNTERNEKIVDPDRNEALEGERPGEAVFKAIFGSDSEDD